MTIRTRLLATLMVAVGALLACSSRKPAPAARACSSTVGPGGDIGAAVASAPSGGTICLSAGIHQSFAVTQAAAGVTVRGDGPNTTTIEARGGDGVVLIGLERLTLSGLAVEGGGPAGIYAARSSGLMLRDVRVTSAALGVHIDEGSSATLENVTIQRSGDVGLLVRRGATVSGDGLRVHDTGGPGVAAVAGAGSLTLRRSEILRAAGPGLFAGISGCGDLGAGALDVPPCFYDNLNAYITDTTVTLDQVAVADGPGTGLVFFPGVRARLSAVDVRRQELTGLFAWGAQVDIAGSAFDDNVEHAIEYRAYPDPRGDVLRPATGSVRDSTIERTRPLAGPALGGGILAQGARLDVIGTAIRNNAAIGVSYVNGSSGLVAASTITGNGDAGLCVVTGSTVELRDSTITGNASDDPNACGGLTP